MKVFVKPIPGTLSQAMWRVARALERYAPKDISVVQRLDEADFQVLHVIAPDSMQALRARQYAMIQYCWNPTSYDWPQSWWQQAETVWSYYDLNRFGLTNFYHSPLGIDEIFLQTPYPSVTRRTGTIITTGYVSGPGAEAIEEVALAAKAVDRDVNHLGPKPVGMSQFPAGWRYAHGISDLQLRDWYDDAFWISGLRWVEGFELPVIEGAARGCVPVVFDRPETRKWFNDFAIFVPETDRETLIANLTDVFRYMPLQLVSWKHREIVERFSWKKIIEGFWASVRQGASV